MTELNELNGLNELAAKLRSRIITLAREAGHEGVTINEAERSIAEHKGHSVSPRFAELVRRGVLVRVMIGQSPKGRPIYQTRWDPYTQRDVYLHWLPEFAPTKKDSPQSDLFTGAA